MNTSKKMNTLVLGLIFTIVITVFVILLSALFFTDKRLQPFLYDCGVDFMGSMICAALFYGCMYQKGDGTRVFRGLILLVSLSFAVNEAMYFTLNQPDMRTFCFALCLLTKLLDAVMIFFFYMYVKQTLKFKGRLASLTDRGTPILLIIEIIILLSNIIYPTTFMVDAGGAYQTTGLVWLEDIYLAAASVLTTILILRNENPLKTKVAALTFIILPLLEYVLNGGSFGNAGQYGTILMSLIIMYCIIFNYFNNKLASTEAELTMATDIQADLLPSIFPAFPDRPEFDIYASMDPAKEVGGDFYDFFLIDDDHLGLVIADVSGKGVPAALFMMSSKILINSHALLGGTPAEILTRVNKQINSTNKAHMFVTVWLGILELSSGKLTTSSAGHEFPMINVSGRYELFKDKHGPAAGALSKAMYTNHEIMLKKGDSIFVYTDGVAEATDANNELFGTDRTLEALNALPEGASQQEVLKGVRTAVDAFVKEAPQFDDLTMLGLRYNGPREQE
jgi:serine phosphatase RsbU (regulator of sigma subunit)